MSISANIPFEMRSFWAKSSLESAMVAWMRSSRTLTVFGSLGMRRGCWGSRRRLASPNTMNGPEANANVKVTVRAVRVWKSLRDRKSTRTRDDMLKMLVLGS